MITVVDALAEYAFRGAPAQVATLGIWKVKSEVGMQAILKGDQFGDVGTGCDEHNHPCIAVQIPCISQKPWTNRPRA